MAGSIYIFARTASIQSTIDYHIDRMVREYDNRGNERDDAETFLDLIQTHVSTESCHFYFAQRSCQNQSESPMVLIRTWVALKRADSQRAPRNQQIGIFTGNYAQI